MNSYLYIDQSLFQQQLLLQQLIIYNQMIAIKQQITLPIYNTPPIAQISKEVPAPADTLPKVSDNLHQPTNVDIKKIKKINKEIVEKSEKSEEESGTQNNNPAEKKKKIFLSMMDIRNAQYKKFKTIEETKTKKIVKTEVAE